jgi:non-ribosomal peptide synthetase component F
VRRNAITSTVWSEAMKRKGRDADCMVFGDDVWSYGRVDAYSNRMARLLHERGVKAGETSECAFGRAPRDAAHAQSQSRST